MNNNSNALSGKEIRNKFIEFFTKKHGHKFVESSSLIPDNPTVLLTTAGMLQFVPIFLGYAPPPTPPRVVSVQKCARAGGKDSDIENVGRTPRHHTFFEMLGNFSFGDYFKEDIIPWAWDFVTNELGLDKSRLWITVFETDDEAYEIWKKNGIPEERILRKGKKDNFWGPPGPTGPCGPCSEIHYDLGEEYACREDCRIDTCECDRFVEIWNLVFMELNKDEEGNYTPLEKKNVDTGMGLERITMVVNGKTSTFETDLLLPILEKVSEMSGKTYKENHKTDVSLRIITDHARCVTFLIADGLVPGNEGRNYVLRMILRRALRHGKILGMELPFLYKLVDTVVENYSDTYPDLAKNRDKIVQTIKKEEERFEQTLGKGEGMLSEIINRAVSANTKIIFGDDAFKLYDTYGFPLELTVEMAQEQGFDVDVEGFNRAMQEQKERAKAAHTKVKLTDDFVFVEVLKNVGASEFTGYSQLKTDDIRVLAVIKDNQQTQSADEGDVIDLILDKTPFYAESGGQTGDTGRISGKSDNNGFELEVLDTQKFDELIIHRCEVVSGTVNVGDTASAEVDASRRKEITIHHTTAHLLQAALRKVLGNSVEQAGSQVEPERTRFDFSFDRALKADEVEKVENIINDWINQDIKQETIVTTPEEARRLGAMALFSEKYGDTVRVVSIEGVSKELCGGTHVSSTGKIRLAKIVSEGAIASGTRRIEVLCGKSALNWLNTRSNELEGISQLLKAPAFELKGRIEKQMDEIKQYQRKIKQLEAEIAQSKVGTLADNAVIVDGGRVLVAKVDGFTPDVLKSAVEKLSDKLGNSVVALASVFDGKVLIIAKVSDNLVKTGINAGQIVNEIALQCEGKGGGRPNFAQAGAKNPANLDAALSKVKENLVKIKV